MDNWTALAPGGRDYGRIERVGGVPVAREVTCCPRMTFRRWLAVLGSMVVTGLLLARLAMGYWDAIAPAFPERGEIQVYPQSSGAFWLVVPYETDGDKCARRNTYFLRKGLPSEMDRPHGDIHPLNAFNSGEGFTTGHRDWNMLFWIPPGYAGETWSYGHRIEYECGFVGLRHVPHVVRPARIDFPSMP